MAGPGKAVDRLGQQATDLRCPGNRCGDQVGFASGTQGAAGRLFEIADRGADRPGAQAGPLAAQPAQAQLGLAAALAAHQLVPLIYHYCPKAGKQGRGLGVGQQQAERFRRGDQDFGRAAQLLAALVAGGVAIADANPQRPAHRLDWLLDRLGQIPAQGPQGREVQQAQAGAGLGQQLGDRTHYGGIGFARAGGHLDQAALAGQVGLPALALERQGRPALTLKPGFDRGEQRAGGIRSPGLAHRGHKCTG